jgi:hypothetical protein
LDLGISWWFSQSNFQMLLLAPFSPCAENHIEHMFDPDAKAFYG